MPLFSLSNKVFTGIYSSYYKATLMIDALSKRFISYQHFTFLPVLLVARFGALCTSDSYVLALDIILVLHTLLVPGFEPCSDLKLAVVCGLTLTNNTHHTFLHVPPLHPCCTRPCSVR